MAFPRFILSIFILFVSVVYCSAEMSNTFLYFAYGSNLLARRIHINNPTATRFAIAKLKDYTLDFYGSSTTWGGAPATVVPQSDSHVWGAVWEIREEDKKHLDDQEGVSSGLYDPIEIVVESPTKGNLTCRSYKLHKLPARLGPGQLRPDDRIPSRIYLEVILRGAIESGLPEDYIQLLKKFPNNGSSGGPFVPFHLEYDISQEL